MFESTTFWELIQQEGIVVPLIQRDYAQGRESEQGKRNKFLNALKEALSQEEAPSLHLDFIYGRTTPLQNKNSDDTSAKSFLPIDGQQRLTTLMLLHWYAARVDNIPEEKYRELKKFSYETRVSSRRFCQYLHDADIQLPETSKDDALKKAIRNCSWYRAAWDNDPTISTMLTMLQAIHDTFKREKGLWEKLVDNRRITFQFFDLGKKDFALTDELYIKMNSRGKQLTNFENFKAEFISFLNKKYNGKKSSFPEKYYRRIGEQYSSLLRQKDTPHADYFSFRFEKEWTDLFWAYRYPDNSIEEVVSSYFDFITQYCFFRDNKGAAADDFKSDNFDVYKRVYDKEENLFFLFDSLDLLYSLAQGETGVNKENLAKFFETIFTNEELEHNPEGKINLCRKSKEAPVKLFEKALPGSGALGRKEEILLFCLFYYMITHDISQDTQDLQYLRNTLRVIRNLLRNLRTRQETIYVPDIRSNNFGHYWVLFEQILSQKNIEKVLCSEQISSKESTVPEHALEEEKRKAEVFKESQEIRFKLEELSIFEGILQQLDVEKNFGHLEDFYNAIRDIWGSSTTPKRQRLAIRALIACGFDSIYIRGHWSMGALYSFGGTEQRYWERILATSLPVQEDKPDTSVKTDIEHRISSEFNAKKPLQKMLLAYKGLSGSPEERLQKIIDKGLQEITDKNINNNSREENDIWRYYFLKYPAFTKVDSQGVYYAWGGNSCSFIQILKSENASPLRAYHINGYAWAVGHEKDVEKWCNLDWSYAQGNDYPPLKLKNNIEMRSKKDGWHIGANSTFLSECSEKEKEIIHQFIDTHLKKYEQYKEEFYILPVNEKKGDDRVAIAVDFIKSTHAGLTPPEE